MSRIAGVLVLVLSVCLTGAAQAVWYVDAAANGAMTGTTADPFATLAAGLAAATTGDIVLVAPGTYAETDLDFGGKDVVVGGTGGAAVTIVDAGDSGRCFLFTNGEGPGAVLEGLTLRNGRAPDGDPFVLGSPGDHGGAILCDGAAPMIRDCIIEDSQAGWGVDNNGLGPFGQGGHGGAVAVRNNGAPVFENTTFRNNVSGDVFGNTPSGPSLGGNGADGGAVWVESGAASFTDCVFEDNRASHGITFLDAGGPGGRGGAIAVWAGGSVQLIRCRLENNDSGNGAHGYFGQDGGRGGAVWVQNGTLTAVECEFLANRTGDGGLSTDGAGAGGSGGAVALEGATATFDRCLFDANSCGDGGTPFSSFSFPGLGGSGGAVFSSNTVLTVHACRFTNNVAGDGGSSDPQPPVPAPYGGHGGAFFVDGGTVQMLSTLIASNRAGDGGTVGGFVENPGSGGALYATPTSNVALVGTTLADNLGGQGATALYTVADVIEGPAGTLLSNSIVWNPTIVYYTSLIGIGPASDCIVQGGWPGTNVTTADPMFDDPPNGDYGIGPGSPAFGAGNAAAPAAAIDVDGEPRVFYGALDIGTDEHVGDCFGGSAGESILTVDGSGSVVAAVPIGQPSVLAVAQPAGYATPAAWAVAGFVGEPTPARETSLGGGLGTVCFSPSIVVAASATGLAPLLLGTPAPWSTLLPGVFYPASFTLQGVVETGPGVFAVTNAVVMRVE